MDSGLERTWSDPLKTATEELEALRAKRGALLILGAVLIFLGALAIGSSLVTTLATVIVFGVVALIGGIAQVLSAFSVRRWRGFFWNVLEGILYIVVGFFLVNHPGAAAAGLTMMIAVFLLVAGLFKMVVAAAERFPGRGWMFLGGLIALLLGLSIWRQWPISGLWVIGLFIGIQLVLTGWSWVAFALALRSGGGPGEARQDS